MKIISHTHSHVQVKGNLIYSSWLRETREKERNINERNINKGIVPSICARTCMHAYMCMYMYVYTAMITCFSIPLSIVLIKQESLVIKYRIMYMYMYACLTHVAWGDTVSNTLVCMIWCRLFQISSLLFLNNLILAIHSIVGSGGVISDTYTVHVTAIMHPYMHCWIISPYCHSWMRYASDLSLGLQSKLSHRMKSIHWRLTNRPSLINPQAIALSRVKKFNHYCIHLDKIPWLYIA